MAGQNGLLFSKVPRHRSAVYLRIEQSSQLKQEFFIIFQCPLDGEQFTLAVGSVKDQLRIHFGKFPRVQAALGVGQQSHLFLIGACSRSWCSSMATFPGVRSSAETLLAPYPAR